MLYLCLTCGSSGAGACRCPRQGRLPGRTPGKRELRPWRLTRREARQAKLTAANPRRRQGISSRRAVGKPCLDLNLASIGGTRRCRTPARAPKKRSCVPPLGWTWFTPGLENAQLQASKKQGSEIRDLNLFTVDGCFGRGSTNLEGNKLGLEDCATCSSFQGLANHAWCCH